MKIYLDPGARDWIQKRKVAELQVKEVAGAGGMGCCSSILMEMVADFGKPSDSRPHRRVDSEGLSFYIPERVCGRYSGLRIFLQDLKFFKSLKVFGIE